MKGSFFVLLMSLCSLNILAQSTVNFNASQSFTFYEYDVITIIVERTGSLTGATSVDLVLSTPTTDGATPGLDYTDPGTVTLNWPDGDHQPRIVNIPIINDTETEVTFEFIDISLQNLVNAIAGSPTFTTVSIKDDDTGGVPPQATVKLSAFEYLTNEGAGTFNVTLERLAVDLAQTVTLDLNTGDFGQAVGNADYTSGPFPVTFNPGDVNATVNIPILEDANFEGQEGFVIFLNNISTNAVVGVFGEALVLIDDNDPPPPAGEFRFSAEEYFVDENGTSVTLTVERINGSFGAVDVEFYTDEFNLTRISLFPTATTDVDFTGDTGTILSWTDGETTSKTVTVLITDDSDIEGYETFLVKLRNATNGSSFGFPSVAEVTIRDNDHTPGEIRFDMDPYDAYEEDGFVDLVVQRVNGSEGVVVVSYDVSEVFFTRGSVGISATGDVDFDTDQGFLLWNDGDTTDKIITVNITDDTEVEGDEFFQVSLFDPEGGVALVTPDITDVNIIDNDGPGVIQFASPTYTVNEAVGTVTVEVLRLGGSGGAVSVTLAALAGTVNGAIPNVDFTPPPTTVTFADGVSGPQPITFAINNDTEFEPDETILLDISNPTGGAAIGSPFQSTVTIQNDDVIQPGELRFTSLTFTGVEGGMLTGSVERVNGDNGAVFVEVITSELSTLGRGISGGITIFTPATAELDYTPIFTTLNWNDGEAGVKTFQVPLLEDTEFEGDEAFTLALTQSIKRGGVIGIPNVATAIINDNDFEPIGDVRIENAQYSIAENNGPLTVNLLRENGSSGELTVSFSTTPGDATADVDYQSFQDFPVTFQDGETIKQVQIPIFDDNDFEEDETFGIQVSGNLARGEVIRPPNSIVTIVNDDQQPQQSLVNFAAIRYEVRESQGGLDVTLVRIGDLDGTGTVLINTADITAQRGDDYERLRDTINFGSGQSTATVRVPIIDDDEQEGDEVFELILSNTTGNIETTTPDRVRVTILANDEPNPPGLIVFTQDVYTAREESRTAEVVLQRIDGQSGRLEVDVIAAAGTARALDDFQPFRAPTTFADGEVGPKVISIPIIDDSSAEPTEFFNVRLERPDGTSERVEVEIIDNDLPRVSWTIAQQKIIEDDTSTKAVNVQLEAVLDFPASQRLEAPYRFAGNAKPGEDHDLREGFLVFQAGEERATLSFNILGDEIEENDEFLFIDLLPSPDVNPGNPRVHRILIEDNDQGRAPNTVIVKPDPSADGPFLVGQPITFRAETPGVDGEVTWCWEIRASKGGFLITKNEQEFSEVITEPGIYDVSCFAKTGENADGTPASIRIRVDAEKPPKVNILQPETDILTLKLGDTFTFKAEIDTTSTPIEWLSPDRPDERGEGEELTRTFNRLGSFVIVARAKDIPGRQSTDFVTVQITRDGDPPAQVGINEPSEGQRFQVGESVQFTGEPLAENRKTEGVRYFWIFDGITLEGLSGSHAFSTPGRKRVRFFAQDGQGHFEKTVNITIVDNSPPEVDFNFPTDREIEPGQDIFYAAKLLNNKGYRSEEVAFFWDFGNGETSNLRVPGAITYPEPGIYTALLFAKVRDTGVQSEPVTRTITVVADDPDRFEPNELLIEAALVTPGTYGNQTLDDDSSIDWYKVTIDTAGQRLIFNVDIPGGANVKVFDADEELIQERDLDGPGNISLQGLDPGMYFIRIEAEEEALKNKATLSYSITVEVLDPALYIPDVQYNETYQTQIGMVNPTGDTASVEIIGYDSGGSIVDTIQFEIPANGRSHQDLGELFGDNASDVSWVQVDSTRDIFGYGRTESRDFTEDYGITAAKRLSSELFVPHIAERTEQWFTEASVINGSDGTAVSEIQAPTTNLELKVDDAFSQDAFDFLDRFGGDIPEGNAWATFKETTENTALAGSEIFGQLGETRMIAGLQLADVRKDNPNFTFIGNNLYFTHVAQDTNQFWTGIALVNIGEATQGVRIKAFGASGNALTEKTIELQPGDKIVEIAESFLDGIGSPADVAWFFVEADLEVVGYELFGTHDNLRIAGLEATTALSNELCYPFIDTDPGVVHGISVVNVNDAAATVTATLYNDLGESVGTTVINLNPRQKFTETIENLFPEAILDPSIVPGWLECTSTLPLAGFELFINTDNNQQMGALRAQ